METVTITATKTIVATATVTVKAEFSAWQMYELVIGQIGFYGTMVFGVFSFVSAWRARRRRLADEAAAADTEAANAADIPLADLAAARLAGHEAITGFMAGLSRFRAEPLSDVAAAITSGVAAVAAPATVRARIPSKEGKGEQKEEEKAI